MLVLYLCYNYVSAIFIPWNDFDPLRDYFVHNKDKI